MTPHQDERKQEPRPSHASSEQLESTLFAPTPTFPFENFYIFILYFFNAHLFLLILHPLLSINFLR